MSEVDQLDEKERLRLLQMLAYEEQAYSQGYQVLAGLDEAGRGPLAGPVVAAACILPQGFLVAHVNDSKKLQPKLREKLYDQLTHHSEVVYAVGIIEADEIDQINIYQATIQAMLQAVVKLSVVPDYLLVDGMKLVHPSISSLKIIKGDQLSQSIAAASIIAKETRDRLMRHYHEMWPFYGFDKHKGYGTAKHLEALHLYGPSPIHRQSFEPLKSRHLKIESQVLITKMTDH